jgi:ligand-binding SRPBCC domain-containing protein
MIELVLLIEIAAAPGVCFDLARSMDFHRSSMSASGERIVGGRATGLISLGEEVEFEARHLGMTRRLRARVTEFERPRRFVDEQVAGPFRSLRHEHLFEANGGGTRLTDRVRIEVGWGVLGWLAERLVVGPHLQRVLRGHQENIKRAAESEEWKAFGTAGL